LNGLRVEIQVEIIHLSMPAIEQMHGKALTSI